MTTKAEKLAAQALATAKVMIDRLLINDENGEESPFVIDAMDLADAAAESLGKPRPYTDDGEGRAMREEYQAYADGEEEE